MTSYWQTMDQFLSMQQDVMQAFLGAAPSAGAPAFVPAAAPTMAEPSAVFASPVAGVAPTPPVLAAPAPAPPPIATVERVPVESAPHVNGSARNGAAVAHAAPPATLGAPAIRDILLKIVADRTGYPPDMIDVDLDLEADLGIDSIKRVEILGTLQQQTGLLGEHDMEALASRKTLRQVSDFLAERTAPAAGAPAAVPAKGVPASAAPAPAAPLPALPFITRVLSHDPGRRLVAVREVRLDEDRYLRDHTLGRDVSTLDPGLAGLPVMPLTMSMEMLAEAAVALVPGRRLIGMRDVRAYRWMAMEGEALTVRLVATAQGDDGREVAVQAFEGEAPAAGPAPTPIVEGTMLLADEYPAPPAAGAFTLAAGRPSRFSPDDLYRDVMFHGPAFRGVARVDQWGQDGATATLRTLPADSLFASTRTPALVTDPVLMDQPGQVVGMWTADHLETGFVVFPFHLEALHLFGPPPPAGRTLQCQARIALVGEQQVRSDLDVVDGDRVVARLVGWWDRRFDLPAAFVRFLYSPAEATLGRRWSAPLAGWPGAEAFESWRLGTDDFPENFLTSHGGVWQRALARAVLGRNERLLWQALRVPEPRRVEWLLGRVVAKSALRSWLEAHHGLKLAPADLEILPDENGRPVPSGDWSRGLAARPVLSLAHANGIAVAVVGPGDGAAGVGVDLEHAAQISEDAGRVAFTDGERALLAAAGGDEWPLRLWCAKEAAAKALGLGLAGGPRALVATAIDVAAGTVTLRVGGEIAARLPEAGGRILVSHTARERDLVVAASLYIPQ